MKEAMFRDRARGKMQGLCGLTRVMDWIDSNGIKKAAVTNAPRPNAEFMLDVIERRSWFTELIIGNFLEFFVLTKYEPITHYILTFVRIVV